MKNYIILFFVFIMVISSVSAIKIGTSEIVDDLNDIYIYGADDIKILSNDSLKIYTNGIYGVTENYFHFFTYNNVTELRSEGGNLRISSDGVIEIPVNVFVRGWIISYNSLVILLLLITIISWLVIIERRIKQ